MASIQLKEISTRAPKEFDKDETKAKMDEMLGQMDELQNLLYASNTYSVLIILQGMDASGKDGAVRKVFGPMNPQGVTVHSFKVPTEEELAHDFLWRIHKYAPAKGMIQIFNRSQYEDVLVTRVHKLIDDKTAMLRMKAINDFEELLARHNNTVILKFYLHVSEEEQSERLKERLKEDRKKWKYNANDFEEAKLRKQYRKAYEDCFKYCNKVPWIIVPADQNWYKEYIIAKTIVKGLENLNMKYPQLNK